MNAIHFFVSPAQLPAGGMDIPALALPHDGRESMIHQGLAKSLNIGFCRAFEGAARVFIEGNQIDFGRDSL